MSDLAYSVSNNDCNSVEQLWNFLDNPQSGEWYLGRIIKNGLTDSLLGINIPPFSTVDIGDIPTQTMFKWETEYMGITLTGTQLSGLDTYNQSSNLHCSPTSASETAVDLTLNFDKVVFSGRYDVGLSGVSGCAIATAAAVLGGDVSLLAATPTETPEDQQLDLARWFRDDDQHGLQASENGKTLVGAYYLHQDTLQKVTTADNNYASQYRQELAKQQQTSNAVYDANDYYKKQRTDSGRTKGDPPTIGEAGQYAGGFALYSKLQLATRQIADDENVDIVAELQKDELDNEYAQLINAMGHFNDQVLTFQQVDPKPVTTQRIMNYIPTANPDHSVGVAASVDAEEPAVGIPIFNLETGEIVQRLPLRPLNKELIAQALAANVDVAERPGTFHVKGTFTDAGQSISLALNVTFTNQSSSLTATVNSINLSIGDLGIELGNKAGWNDDSLYNKVADWIANTGSFQDMLKSKLNIMLNSDEFKAKVQDALNGGLKKLGL